MKSLTLTLSTHWHSTHAVVQIIHTSENGRESQCQRSKTVDFRYAEHSVVLPDLPTIQDVISCVATRVPGTLKNFIKFFLYTLHFTHNN